MLDSIVLSIMEKCVHLHINACSGILIGKSNLYRLILEMVWNPQVEG